MKLLFYYLLLISLLSGIVTAYDKAQAVRKKQRVREKTLWLLAFLGGALGMYLCMLLIRHKTKHQTFMVGLPALILSEALVLYAISYFIR